MCINLIQVIPTEAAPYLTSTRTEFRKHFSPVTIEAQVCPHQQWNKCNISCQLTSCLIYAKFFWVQHFNSLCFRIFCQPWILQCISEKRDLFQVHIMLKMARVETNCLLCALPSCHTVYKSESMLWALDNKFIENDQNIFGMRWDGSGCQQTVPPVG